MNKLLFFLCFLGLSNFTSAQEIRTYMDLQTHPTVHIPYPFFEEGLTWFEEDNPPELSYKHLLTNINYANYLKENPGVRILVVGALPPEVVVSRKKAWRIVIEQIRYVNEFTENHPEDFVVAKTPQEVRSYITQTDKTVIIHSIEGGKMLVNSYEDAKHWAEQGVAFITLIHLIDDKHGGAAIRPGLSTEIINYKGSMKKKFRSGKERGLTERGKQAILWLANAGIMTDLTHMSDETRKDALVFMEEHDIPPIVTHDLFKPIQNHPRGIEPDDILKIYRNNGFMSLPISGITLKAYHPYPEYQAKLDSLNEHCPGSIDSYKFTYQALKNFLEAHVGDIFQDSSLIMDQLSETQKVDLSIGFQSDFNGWLDHSRPRYGEEGCWEADPNQSYEAIELQGLAHPGLLESQWELLEKEGIDLLPIQRSSEKFLQLWEYFLERQGTF